MFTFIQESKAQQTTPSTSTVLSRARFEESDGRNAVLHLQRTFGNQAGRETDFEQGGAGLVNTASTRLRHDFSQIPLRPPEARGIQTKLSVNEPGDEDEQEADRVAGQMISMSEPNFQRAGLWRGGPPKCQNQQAGQIQTKPVQGHPVGEATRSAEWVISSPGQPLDSATRAFFEPRFGQDFSSVRVHTDSASSQSARNINALAYTLGHHIVFERDQYQPQTSSGRKLLAHELTHVIQQKTQASQTSKYIQRQARTRTFIGPTMEISERLRCLESLFDEMSSQTQWYLTTACRDGNYLTSRSGVRYIPEDRADAFGHCWIGCQGAKTCGEGVTRILGGAHEVFREAMSYLSLGFWGHNSYDEDTFNQRYGRELARNNPEGDCSRLCYQALLSGALRFHGHHTGDDPARPRVYLCSAITIRGHEYHQGWRTIPLEDLARF
jgi:hypothetical protein